MAFLKEWLERRRKVGEGPTVDWYRVDRDYQGWLATIRTLGVKVDEKFRRQILKGGSWEKVEENMRQAVKMAGGDEGNKQDAEKDIRRAQLFREYRKAYRTGMPSFPDWLKQQGYE